MRGPFFMLLLCYISIFVQFVSGFNSTHAVRKGQDSGKTLNPKTIMCLDGSICIPKKIQGRRCFEFKQCTYPCSNPGMCRRIVTGYHKCLRYTCYHPKKQVSCIPTHAHIYIYIYKSLYTYIYI